MLASVQNFVAKVEGYWAAAFGFVGAHPKTATLIIVALVAARLFFK